MANYSGCKSWSLPHYLFSKRIPSRLCVREDSKSVHVSYNIDEPSDWALFNWKMYLQVYSGGSWKTIGTRTGYVTHNSPSNRSFSVGYKGYRMRVQMYVECPDAPDQRFTSAEWVR